MEFSLLGRRREKFCAADEEYSLAMFGKVETRSRRLGNTRPNVFPREVRNYENVQEAS